MSKAGYLIILGLMVLGLNGCSTGKMDSCQDGRSLAWFCTPSQQMLGKGNKFYEEGNYPNAITQLQGVIDMTSATSNERIEAYKTLAFIHCVSSRTNLCAESFKKALELNPKFDLSPAEVGHPIWGPIFLSTKKSVTK